MNDGSCFPEGIIDSFFLQNNNATRAQTKLVLFAALFTSICINVTYTDPTLVLSSGMKIESKR